MKPEMLEQAIFDIQGYEGIYGLDRDGNLYTKRRSRHGIGQLWRKRQPAKNSNGYILASLVDRNGFSRFYEVHRLMAQTFLKPDKLRKYVNHKNGIKTDNRIENLEWCTSAENNKHAFTALGKRGPQHRGKDHPLSTKIRYTSISGETGIAYGVTEAAKHTGVSRSHIHRIMRGESRPAIYKFEVVA